MKTIFFDLDGTLLKMDQDYFVKLYFGSLSHYCRSMIPEDKMIKGLTAGVKAMIINDGKMTNEEKFWSVFDSIVDVPYDRKVFEEFYPSDFKKTIAACSIDNDALTLIHILKEKGYRLVLATNPLFPRIGTLTRMGFVDLKPEDFELVTTYERCHYCKPNLDYYREILIMVNEKADNVIMVGNDVNEDLVTKELGFETVCLTDCLINKYNKEIDADFIGTIKEYTDFVKENY